MAIAAKISSDELTAQVTDRFANQYLEARLINAPGTSYEPGITNDTSFLGFEVVAGTGGYQRQCFSYAPSDVSNYADDGVGLTTKATIFAQDGSITSIGFSHAVLVWSTGNVSTLGAITGIPGIGTGVNGTYLNIPIDSTSGSGHGLTVDVTVANSGQVESDYTITLNKAGYDYAAGDTLVLIGGTLAGLGIISSDSGNLAFSVGTATSASARSGKIVAVAQTSSAASLTAGNEAIFYWNLKQFGFYTP